MIHELIVAIIVAMGIPSAIFGLYLRRFEKRMDDKEQARKDINVLLIQGVRASISLGEAAAIALRDGKTNGETKEALKYASEAKHGISDFLTKQGIENIF